jgi:hypothetical protein
VSRQESYRYWSVYVRNVVLWFLVTAAICTATVFGIFKGISFVMDYFLQDDRFYEGFAASIGVSGVGTIVLFVCIFFFIRELGRYPRRRFKGLQGM